MLSCSCYDDCDWYYEGPVHLKGYHLPRRRRCCSCHDLISKQADCTKFFRWRSPYTDIEERIHGDSVYLADWYMCESCTEIFLNLSDIGYCIYLGGDMRDLLKEYWDLTGFISKETENV